MSIFTADNADAWRSLFASVGREAPRIGQLAQITKGRKHRGFVGRITYIGRDQFYRGTRYMDGAQLTMMEAMKRHGYRVGLVHENGGAPIYVNAENITICVEVI